jgi:hypothetical protein
MTFPDPKPLRDELLRLLEMQLSALEMEDFGVITAPEILRYRRRQERIDELYNKLLANHAADADASRWSQANL